MSDQDANQERWDEGPNGSRSTQSLSPWVVPVVALIVVSLASLFWWLGQTTASVGTVTQLEQRNAPRVTVLTAATPTATSTPTPAPPAEIALLPTPTPTTERPTTSEPLTLLLPTATPTSEATNVPLHVVVIDGATTLSMTLAGTDFSTTGRSLRMAFDKRDYEFGGRTMRHLDRWCIQLGIVHVILEVDLVMDASTQNVRGQGTARLMADYCNEPGNQISEIPITFMTPANDRAQFVYMLRGQRNFLNMPGILDTETNISIILNVQNRPVE